MRRLAFAALAALSACAPRGHHHAVTPREIPRQVPYRLELQWSSQHPSPRPLDGACYRPGEVDRFAALLETQLRTRATPGAPGLAAVAVELEELSVEWKNGPAGAPIRKAQVRLVVAIVQGEDAGEQREVWAEAAEEATPGSDCGPLVREAFARAAARVDGLVGDALGSGATP